MREEIHGQRNYNSLISYTQKMVLKEKNPTKKKWTTTTKKQNTHNQQFFFFFVKLNKWRNLKEKM